MLKHYNISSINEALKPDNTNNNPNLTFLCYTDRFENIVGLKLISLEYVEKLTSTAGYFTLTSKRWRGETEREILVIVDTNGILSIGIGDSEIMAANNLCRVGIFSDVNLSIFDIAKTLHWTLPDNFIDFQP